MAASLVVLRSQAVEPLRAFEDVEPRAPASAVPRRSTPVEGMLWAGCSEVYIDREPIQCTFVGDSAVLRLWLPSRVSEPALALDGAPLPITSSAQVDAGTSLQVAPGHHGRLTVSGKVDGGTDEFLLLVFDVEMRPRPDRELRQRLDAVVGHPVEQRAFVQELRQRLAGAPSVQERLLLTRYLQYVFFDLGDYPQSVVYALEAADLSHAQGELLTETGSLWAASFMLGDQLGDEQAALAVLERVSEQAAAVPSVDMMNAYYQGLVELNLDRQASARFSIERSTQIARRLRWPRWEIIALNPLVDALASQGRFAWARQTLERAHALAATNREVGLLDRCEAEARHHRKLGDLAEREAQLTGLTRSAVREHWQAASTIFHDRERCPDHSLIHLEAADLDVDLARAMMMDGDLDRAEAMIDGLTPEHLAPVVVVRERLLRAELALERGKPRAAEHILRKLVSEAERGMLAEAVDPEAWWRLHLDRARAYHERGKLAAALDALARAQQSIDGERPASLGIETDRRAAMRRGSSQLLVRILLERGHVQPAACAARVARARSLAGLGARSEPARASLVATERARAALYESYKWYDPRDIPVDERMRLDLHQRASLATLDLPAPIECDQLPAAQPGEAAVLYFHDGHGWLGFAWGPQTGVLVRRLSLGPESLPPESSSATLIAPFATALEGATRLRVLAPAVLGDTSFADLEWNGGRLGDVLTVANALDLPRVPLELEGDGTVALVFSDPENALSGEETLVRRFDEWRSTIESRGQRVTFGLGPSQAGSRIPVKTIVDGTRGVELALFYGFGAVRPSYYDLLAESAREAEPDQHGFGLGFDVLTRTDVLLAAGFVPRHVVLAHCDSATTDLQGVAGAIGLAQSYVQAGSEWALGAMGNVDPESMAVMVDVVLADHLHGSGVDHVARLLQSAKQRIRERGLPDAERLRLWIP